MRRKSCAPLRRVGERRGERRADGRGARLAQGRAERGIVRLERVFFQFMGGRGPRRFCFICHFHISPLHASRDASAHAALHGGVTGDHLVPKIVRAPRDAALTRFGRVCTHYGRHAGLPLRVLRGPDPRADHFDVGLGRRAVRGRVGARAGVGFIFAADPDGLFSRTALLPVQVALWISVRGAGRVHFIYSARVLLLLQPARAESAARGERVRGAPARHGAGLRRRLHQSTVAAPTTTHD